MKKIIVIILLASLLIAATPHQAPERPVKLIFIHHSTGENWLADGYGDLGKTLGENNYFVSDTNYGWGPDGIGDRTDIPDWVEWFASDETPTYMDALFNEVEQNSSYTRTLADPGGENEIIMFKSCFPNSNLDGNPNDPPGDYGDLTVAGAKYVYNTILETFAVHPDKLFIVVTAPPLSDDTNAANARAFNNWLVNDWLADYEGTNVAVFDFYDVLTGHGTAGDTLYYPSGDDHPNEEGSRIATAEFLPQLNNAYKRWQAGDTSALPASEVPTSSPETFSAPPASASSLIDNFEGDAPEESYGWQAYADETEETSLSCNPSNEKAYSDSQSLKIDYDVALYSWATCDLTFENDQNWGDTSGISFYVYAVQDDAFFDVDIMLENATGVESYVHQIWLDSSKEWTQVYIPWSEFKRVDWEENAGAPFTKPDQIRSLVFGFGTPDDQDIAPKGIIYIDNLTLGQTTCEDSPPENSADIEEPEEAPPPEETPAEDEPSGNPLPCVGGLILPLGLAGVAFRRKKEK